MLYNLKDEISLLSHNKTILFITNARIQVIIKCKKSVIMRILQGKNYTFTLNINNFISLE